MPVDRSAIGRRSKRKGKGRELEWANFLKEHGFDTARRTSQYCGQAGDADVIAPGYTDDIHWEVKGAEQLNLWEAIGQAIEDSKGKKTPVVTHRKNRTGWLITMEANDWLKLYAKANGTHLRMETGLAGQAGQEVQTFSLSGPLPPKD